ncbi:MAG: PspC domain-containing protein [Chitinophagaceae bacterium]
MKKVININFQGRVIPIEESAYDILKQYVESLRRFFNNEEGRDEIINDIEGRIAELFGETLKKGSTCITDEDVNTIIASMGRPEDFEADEAKVQSQLGAESKQQSAYSETHTQQPRGGLYRDENDKILGGVCAGLANYLRMDPSIVRILFAIITFGGFGAGFLIYIILWIILPSKSLQSQMRKRMYRNPDDKVIGGVASGIAAYFNIAVWIPRLIFALPIILGVFSSVFQNAFFHFDPFPSIIFGSFGSTFFIIYVVLWAVIPQANTASEKLEMRGEKVDLNSIKNTIQEDLGSFKNRAEKWGSDFKEKAEKFGTEFKETVQQRSRSFTAETTPVVRSTGRRLGNAIGILFKGFFLLMAGIIAFALLMVMLGLMIGGISAMPLKDFFLDGFWQNFLAWSTLILFLGVPVVGLLIWLIRRMIGARSKNPYLGWIFGGLWTLGWISVIILTASILNNYKTKAGVEEKVNIVQPINNKLIVKASHQLMVNYYGSDWYGIHWDNDDAPFFGLTEDSFMMRTIQVRVVKSEDSAYHINMIKFSRGSNPADAKLSAQNIIFNAVQNDSLLILPQGFTLTKNQKFRNQQVLLIVEVPVNKKIELDKSVTEYKWFDVDIDNSDNRGWGNNLDENWNNDYRWRNNVEYFMTDKGLKPTHPSDEDQTDENNSDDAKQQLEQIEKQKQELDQKQQELKQQLQQDSSRYHYQPEKKDTIIKAPENKKQKPVIPATQASANTDIFEFPAGFLLMKIAR